MRQEIAIAEPELRLLCLCVGSLADNTNQDAIREILEGGIDWTGFARKAAVHDVAGLAGYSLARTAPDIVPGEVLDALRLNAGQLRGQNRALLGELLQIADRLAGAGIEAIAFKAPVSDIRFYCELGLRPSENPALLLNEGDISRAVGLLGNLSYARRRLSSAQLDLIRRLRGNEVLVKPTAKAGIGLYTRLTPMRAGFDIDHPALWRRARRTTLQGRTLATLAPEDELLLLAAQYGEDRSWSVGWACDVVGLIAAHPTLEWSALLASAHAQGLLPMLLVATELARTCFNARIPETVAAAGRDTPTVQRAARRIVADWRAERPAGPAGWGNWLQPALLRNGGGRRARYLAGALFLPDERHIARMPLPDRFVRLPPYIALKLAQDLALLPLMRGWRGFRTRVGRARDRLAGHEATIALVPLPAGQRGVWKKRHAAHAAARRAAAADPNDLTARSNLGDALFELTRYPEAIACYEKVLASAPGNRSVWLKCARARAAIGEAAGWRDADVERIPDPDDADGWTQRAGFLVAMGRFAEAAAASDRALAINPNDIVAKRIGVGARISCCDWRRRDADKRWVLESLHAGRHALTPFSHRAISDSDAENLLSAQLWAKGIARPARQLWNGEQYRHEKIRIAYLSAEFRDHPTSILIAGVFEHHDRTRFEVTAVSLGPRSTVALRRRIDAACDRIIEAENLTDADAAAAVRAIKIDIAVDLNGHAGAGRAGILAHRPAPVQVNYLGNAGTTGAPFLDYIIADRTVLPPANFPYYTEQVVYLPHSYQSNDSRRNRPGTTLSRYDAGLPETGFVYCCFNNLYKISPEVFDVWMRLLNADPRAVLWLLGDDRFAIHNLRREAGAHGVAPERLVFAPRAPVDEHLARHALADLFLDTLPMNAHATASDALWAGLPVLTCLGNSFGGRVAGSLLRAVGLSELVTKSLTEYEELALALTRDPGRLAAIKAKLARNRDTEPLFDTPRYTRDLESAYIAMWGRQQAGLPPTHIDIAMEAQTNRSAEGARVV